MGLLVTSPEVSLENVSISGYNNCGANFETGETENSLYVDGLTIDNVGRKGLLLYGFEGSINDLSITNITDLDELHQADPNPETGLMEFCGFVDRNVGARIFSANVDLSNVHIDEVEGYGLSVVQANSAVDTIYAGNSVCAPAISFQGSLTVDNGEFVGYSEDYDALGASLVGYESTLLQVTNSSFEGTKDEYGYLVFARGGENFFFENNTFTDGAIAIYTYDAGLTLTGNTFTDQSSYGLYLNGDGLRSQVLSDNVFQSNDTLFTTAIQCYSGDNMEISGDSFTDIYGYYAVSSYSCSLEMEDVSFENIGYYGISSYGGDLELDSMSFTNTGINAAYTPAIYQSVSDPTNVSIVNSTFDNLAGDVISLTTSDSTNAPLNVIMDTISITNAGDEAIYLSGATADLNNITITDALGDGIQGTDADITLVDGAISGSGNDGFYCSNCTLSVSNSTISSNTGKGFALSTTNADFSSVYAENNGEHGVYANEGTLSLTASYFTGNGSFGAEIQGSSSQQASVTMVSSDFSNSGKTGLFLTNADISMTSGTSSNNSEYGMECENTSFSVCTMANITGNTLGEQTGCDETCGEEANPSSGGGDTGGAGDTGSGDTGSSDTGDTGN